MADKAFLEVEQIELEQIRPLAEIIRNLQINQAEIKAAAWVEKLTPLLPLTVDTPKGAVVITDVQLVGDFVRLQGQSAALPVDAWPIEIQNPPLHADGDGKIDPLKALAITLEDLAVSTSVEV